MSKIISSSSVYNTVTRGSQGLAVVKCGAEWCAPCKKIAPAYESLAAKYTNVRWYTLDVDQVKDFTDVGVITKVPTFLLFKDNNPAGLIQGADIRVVEKHVNELK